MSCASGRGGACAQTRSPPFILRLLITRARVPSASLQASFNPYVVPWDGPTLVGRRPPHANARSPPQGRPKARVQALDRSVIKVVVVVVAAKGWSTRGGRQNTGWTAGASHGAREDIFNGTGAGGCQDLCTLELHASDGHKSQHRQGCRGTTSCSSCTFVHGCVCSQDKMAGAAAAAGGCQQVGQGR